MKEPRYTEDFNKSRLGSTVMEACGNCGTATGTICIKRRGNPNGPEYRGSVSLRIEDARCEFCVFLAAWMRQEKVDPTETGLKYGASKLVERDPESGVDTLVAFVPFSEKEREENLPSIGGEEFKWAHAMVVQCEKTETGYMLVKILDHGVYEILTTHQYVLERKRVITPQEDRG